MMIMTFFYVAVKLNTSITNIYDKGNRILLSNASLRLNVVYNATTIKVTGAKLSTAVRFSNCR